MTSGTDECGRPLDAFTLARLVEEARAERDSALAERDRLRKALDAVRATCEGRIAGEPGRASYLGIKNYIDGAIGAA